jgi:3-dehydroquinate synthase II
MRELWLYSDDFKKDKPLITKALESGYTGIISEDVEKIKELGNILVMGKGGDIEFEKGGAEKVVIQSKKDEEKVSSLAGKVKYAVVDFGNWKIIPMENIIAKIHESETVLVATVKNSHEAKTALETLEMGVGGVALKTTKINEVVKTAEVVREMESGKVELYPAEVTEVKQLGMGDRVCIDTVTMMKEGEGMLIGSQSSGFFLVHAEVSDNPYVEARPFRVNAGAVHSYILNPQGKTNYLSELKSGSEVMIVDKKGKTSRSVVGRIKIEKRPLMFIEAVHKKQIYKIILQNAETIKLIGENGKSISVTAIKPGSKILVSPQEGGRHFGMKIKESIVEK